jgi:beta-lactamase regulating signal transducer with metallopeptidase domain
MFALDVGYPVVAVVGIWHPRLYVARQVVERCDSSELDAIVAHEAAHVDAHDNLTRLLFVAAPVVPYVSGINAEIERAWIAAAEDAADDAARRERSATALASALTKVARLSTGRAPQLCASAILSGSGVEHRVRRLLGSAPEEPHRGWPSTLTGCVAAAGLLALSPEALRTVYDFTEHCVRNLP